MANKQKTIEAQKWDAVVDFFKDQFTDGQSVEVDIMIYLIGVRELGKGHKKFKKREKIDLMHIAVCRLLEPYGFYAFDFFDKDGWPHYKPLEALPVLKAGEQSLIMKKAILRYFDDQQILQREFDLIEQIIK